MTPLFTDAELARMVSPFQIRVERPFQIHVEPPPPRPTPTPADVGDGMDEFRRLAGKTPEERLALFRDLIAGERPDPFIVPARDLSETYRADGDPSAPLFTPSDYLWLVGAFGAIVGLATIALYHLA